MTETAPAAARPTVTGATFIGWAIACATLEVAAARRLTGWRRVALYALAARNVVMLTAVLARARQLAELEDDEAADREAGA